MKPTRNTNLDILPALNHDEFASIFRKYSGHGFNPPAALISRMSVNLEDTTLTQRIVLIAMINKIEQENTPVNAAELLPECEICCEQAAAEVVGHLSEADVTRALNELADKSLITEEEYDRSPVGKGRPAYSLGVDEDATLEALENDERLQPVIEQRVQSDRSG